MKKKIITDNGLNIEFQYTDPIPKDDYFYLPKDAEAMEFMNMISVTPRDILFAASIGILAGILFAGILFLIITLGD